MFPEDDPYPLVREGDAEALLEVFREEGTGPEGLVVPLQGRHLPHDAKEVLLRSLRETAGSATPGTIVETRDPFRSIPHAPGTHGLGVGIHRRSRCSEGLPGIEEEQGAGTEDEPATAGAEECAEFCLLPPREREMFVVHTPDGTRA